MSDDTHKKLNDWGGMTFKGVLVLLGFFAAAEFNDMKEAMHEMKDDIKAISNTVGSTREDLIKINGTVENNKDRIEKLERHSGR